MVEKTLNEWQMVAAESVYRNNAIWISAGLVEGYSTVNKFGRNPDVDTTSAPEDIWGGAGLYTGFPVNTLEPVEALSSSASDAAAGTGLRTVVIQGLNGDWAETSETITLNGTTPVQSVNSYRRVHTMRGETAGSGGFNVGEITIRHATTEANVFLVMQIGTNQSGSSAYTIPAGYTGYLMASSGAIRGGATASADCVFAVRSFGGIFRYRRPFAISSGYSLNETLVVPIGFAEKTDIVIRCTDTSANNIEVTAGYDLILVADNV
jgi:hypothetical protein